MDIYPAERTHGAGGAGGLSDSIGPDLSRHDRTDDDPIDDDPIDDDPTDDDPTDDDPTDADPTAYDLAAYDPIANDPTWSLVARASPRILARRQLVLVQLGRAVLRLRLFLGWTQRDLEAASGVDQTSISRFERGNQQGMSIYRFAAILEAMRVATLEFKPPPRPAPTPLELMLYGDAWVRAGKAADHRLARAPRSRQRRVCTRPPT